jgi:hypothetical protein
VIRYIDYVKAGMGAPKGKAHLGSSAKRRVPLLLMGRCFRSAGGGSRCSWP